jgi:MYXO-CTERM domain-containing protein
MNRKYTKLVVASTLSVATLAQASHFRGAAMVPSVSSTGLLTVTVESFWRPDFLGTATVSITGVGSMARQSVVDDTSDVRFTRRIETFTQQLPNEAGLYSLQWSSDARIAGVRNASESIWSMDSQIRWDGSTAIQPIVFSMSSIQPEVIRGFNYVGSLNAAAAPGLTLSYDQALNTSINSQPPGFTIDPATGAMFIPAAYTATYLDNSFTPSSGGDYAFSGNIFARDSNGTLWGAVEFDWLFDAVNNTGNLAPSVNDASINIAPGGTVSYTFVGTDPNLPLDELEWSFVNLTGPGTPAIAPTFNPLTQQFTWNTTGSAPGTWLAQVRASDLLGLTDVGTLTITIPTAVPEPSAGLALLGLALPLLARRRK